MTVFCFVQYSASYFHLRSISVLEVRGFIEYFLTEGNSSSSLEIMFFVAFRLLLLSDAEGLVDGKVAGFASTEPATSPSTVPKAPRIGLRALSLDCGRLDGDRMPLH